MNHRMQGLGCWMWVMIGLWLGFAPLTSMARVDIRVTESGTQVNMTLTGSANTGSLLIKTKTNWGPALVNPAEGLIVGAGKSGPLRQNSCRL
jgi:hypothetical protein